MFYTVGKDVIFENQIMSCFHDSDENGHPIFPGVHAFAKLTRDYSWLLSFQVCITYTDKKDLDLLAEQRKEVIGMQDEIIKKVGHKFDIIEYLPGYFCKYFSNDKYKDSWSSMLYPIEGKPYPTLEVVETYIKTGKLKKELQLEMLNL